MNNALFQNDDVRKFIKFFFVGVTVFVIHTLTLWLFKRAMSLETFMSATLAYIVATICHFLMNNFFTFNNSDALYRKRISGYIVFIMCNYVINTTVVSVTLNHIIDNVLCATVASAMTTMFFSFFALNKIVFSNSSKV